MPLLPFLLVLLPLTVTAETFVIEPTPDWVAPLEPPTLAEGTAEQLADGIQYLVVDRQIKLGDESYERHAHTAWRVLDSSGLDGYSSFSVEFDPTYQQLRLHVARLMRDGRSIDQLTRDRVQILQREEGMERQLLDGRLTASFIFEDVRVGDIVEYRYTISGDNPALGDRAAGGESLAWGVPVARRQVRLVHPRHRDIATRLFAGSEEPVETGSATRADLRWVAEPQQAILGESNTPAWYMDSPWLQFSEFESWEAVRDWAAPLYQRDAPSAELKRLAETLRRDHPGDRNAQIAAAIDFVQEDIRYLGIEMGHNSLVPRPPELTLERRYGDCKDKSLLLVGLLEALGVEAVPALAHSSMGRRIPDFLPSPFAFNHMITRIKANGRDYFIDPTLTQQADALDRITQPDYGHVLPIDPDAPARLVDTAAFHDPGRTVINESIDEEEGNQGLYHVETRYEGAAADHIRSYIRGQSRQELNQNYLNYTARFYPGAELERPLQVMDDLQGNRVVVSELYRLSPLWQESDEAGRRELDLYPWEVANHLPTVDTPRRNAPLGRMHPVEVTQSLSIPLGDEWLLEDEDHVVEDPQFELRQRVRYDGHTLRLEHEYRSRSDHVKADRLGEFLENVDQARARINFGLYRYDESASAEDAATLDMASLEDGSMTELLKMLSVTLTIGLAPLALWLMLRSHRGDALYLNLLTAPRRVLDHVMQRQDRMLGMVMLAGIFTALTNLSYSDSHERLGGLGLVLAVVFGGAIGGVIHLYLASAVWHLGVKLLRGSGSYESTRVAYGWAVLPEVLALPFMALLAAATWPALFTPQGPVIGDGWLDVGLSTGLGLMFLTFLLWSMLLAVVNIAHVHCVGLGRSLGGGVLGGGLVVGALVLLAMLLNSV